MKIYMKSMKLIATIVTIWLVHMMTIGETFAQETEVSKVSLNLRNVDAEQLFKEINQQTGIRFVYNVKDLEEIPHVNVNAENTEVLTLLKKLYNNEPLVFEYANRVIVVKIKSTPFIIKGRIIDVATGEPLVGATVKVEGISIGTTSGSDGTYRLSLSNSYRVVSVVYSYIGYEDGKVRVHKSGIYDVALKEQDMALSEVVVTGYQTINKTRMTGAVEAITAKDITNKGYASVGEVLRGALPGVSARVTSGKLGAEPEIRIRGLNSLYGNMNPLWVVDGLPFTGSINELVPEDIESITILKDAAATAIYGSQAANGVIVVKRKSGKAGRSSVNVYSTFSFETAPNSKLNMMNSAEKIAFERSVYEDFPNQAVGGRVITLLKNADLGKISHETAETEIERLSHINTDWYDVIFRNAFSQNHVVSYSGGTDRTQYYASVGLRDSKGIVPTNHYKNWNAALRLSHQINRTFSFTVNMSSSLRKDEDSSAGVGVLHYATFANPYERPYDENGNYDYDRSYSYALSTLKDGYQNDFNILNELYNNRAVTNNLSAMLSLELDVNLMKNLRYKTIGSINAGFNNREEVYGAGTYTAKNNAWLASLYPELPNELNNGSAYEINGRNLHYAWSNRLEYTPTFKDKHILSIFLGHEVAEFTGNSNSVTFPEYDADKGLAFVPEIGEKYVSQIQGLIENLQYISESRSRSVSFFMAGTYSFKDRYVLSTSMRLDGADIIGTDNRFSPLWNASFRYNLHREKFMKKVKWLDECAVRFSYGYTGSIDKNALPFNVLSFSRGRTYYEESIPSYIRPKNPSVKWQKKEDRSLGIDLGFLRNRIRLNVNYYNNVTRDLLDQKTLPISVGISTLKYNSSSIRNYGWELNLSTVNVRTRDFSWSTQANLSVNRSKVLNSYYKNPDDIPLGYSRTEPLEGTSINSWLGYHFAGIDPLTGHTLALVDNSGREKPIGFQRPDGTWVLDMDDQANTQDRRTIMGVLGDSYPPFSGGFSTAFTWKDWHLNARFIFMAGHKIQSAYYSVAAGGSIYSASQNVLKEEANRWRKPGDITNMPGYNLTGVTPSLSTDMYDRKLEDGSFLKCSEITLGYNLPSEYCKKLHLKSCGINMNMRDLFTLSKYKGLDPENFGGFSYPNSRKFMLSLSLGF